MATLGVTDELVGVVHSCDWPEKVARLPLVTSPPIPQGGDATLIDQVVRERHAAGLPLFNSRPEPRLVDRLEWLAAVLHPTRLAPWEIPARRIDLGSALPAALPS